MNASAKKRLAKRLGKRAHLERKYATATIVETVVKANRVKNDEEARKGKILLTFEGGHVPAGVRLLDARRGVMFPYPVTGVRIEDGEAGQPIRVDERVSPDAVFEMPDLDSIAEYIEGAAAQVAEIMSHLGIPATPPPWVEMAEACVDLKGLFRLYDSIQVELREWRKKDKTRTWPKDAREKPWRVTSDSYGASQNHMRKLAREMR